MTLSVSRLRTECQTAPKVYLLSLALPYSCHSHFLKCSQRKNKDKDGSDACMGCMYQQGWQVQHGYFLEDGRTGTQSHAATSALALPSFNVSTHRRHPPLPITRAVGQDGQGSGSRSGGSLITISHGRGLRTLSSPSPPTTTPRPISKHAFLQNESHLLSQYDRRASSCQPASQAIPSHPTRRIASLFDPIKGPTHLLPGTKKVR